jgi:hypothetical protein
MRWGYNAGMKPRTTGMFAGCALWAVLLAIGWGYIWEEGFLPLPTPIGLVSAVAALPIAWGGWVYV